MKLAYYRFMENFCLRVAWFWFMIEPTNRSSGAWFESSRYYSRKISQSGK